MLKCFGALFTFLYNKIALIYSCILNVKFNTYTPQHPAITDLPVNPLVTLFVQRGRQRA